MAQKRRGSGEGSIYKRPDGLYAASVELGRDENGRRQRKVVTAKTRREVQDKLKGVVRRQALGGPVTDDRRPVGEYLTWWLDNVADLKETTAENYRTVIARYIDPYVGTVELGKLAPGHVEAMMKTLESGVPGSVPDGWVQRPVSPRTRQLARSVLRRALGHAVKTELIRRNAAALVDSPRGAGTKLDDAMTADEARKVLEAAKGDRLEAFAVLALTLGFRRGELLGLQWSDVDFEAGSVTVARTLSRVTRTAPDGTRSSSLVTSTPKTSAGARTVPLAGRCGPALKGHRRRQAEERLRVGELWEDSGHVFTAPNGQPLDPANVYHAWQRLTEKAGLGKRRLHASRHTAATLMLDQGVPLEVVSAILGHAGLAITADVYARPTMDAKRRSLDVLADALG